MNVPSALDLQAGCFEFTFGANVELVNVVRRFVEDAYARLLGDKTEGARVGIATHELMENAIKASKSTSRVRIELQAGSGESTIQIRTWNPISRWDLAVLTQAIKELGAVTDGDAHFMKLMHKLANSKTGSGLGLARVFAEARMTLSLEVIDNVACVLAQGKFKDRVG